MVITYQKAFNTIITKPPVIETDLKYSFPYTEYSGLVRLAPHRGQRKLFLTELQFMNTFPKAKYIIYVGAAPSKKSGFFMNLFPNVKVILVDGNDYTIAMHTNTELLETNYMGNWDKGFTDASSMYGSNENITWLHDEYNFQKKWNQGDSMEECINIDNLVTAALCILVSSIQNEYDDCCICYDITSTLTTIPCGHKVICSNCYIIFCSKILKCPLCRSNLDINRPLYYDIYNDNT